MIDSNARTLGVLLAGFVALVVVAQSANRVQVANVSRAIQAPAADRAPEVVPVKAEAPIFRRAAPQLVAIPATKCASTWINGGNYVLVTPTTCNDVAISSITIGVSAKSCETSSNADFVTMTNTTAFKGDYGFYLGQDKAVKCLSVKEIVGKYL
jgi:hypothetical protein